MVYNFLLLLVLGSIFGVVVLSSLRRQQVRKRLEDAFYEILERHNGKITLIQLTAKARVEPEVASQFLERQAQIFSARLDVDENGTMIYYFPQIQ
ncbi:hypothetical protein [Geitlerinema sp. PCC 9228]|uniref:hypothetical protein n=1 Tax=Geitlerinema sp. PCC 9228 TaxID=111611 RepID=UPI0008F99933|nr:hypothetical protein [Geitlerinema sp. PCC 9228]